MANDRKISPVLGVGLGITALGTIAVLALIKRGQPGRTLLNTNNLSGLELSVECNPGGTTNCPCSLDDVALVVHPTYGEVISNINRRNTWVNALAVAKYAEEYPGGAPIGLHEYSLSFETRLPAIPSMDVNQEQNAEQIDFGVFLYDGRDKFGRGAKRRYEIAGIWKLNPFHPDHNKVLVRTTNGAYFDTGIYIPYDLNWHRFTFKGDHDREELISLEIDGTIIDLSGIPTWTRWSPEWGDDVSIWATVESQAMYPQPGCPYVFWWNENYRSVRWNLVK